MAGATKGHAASLYLLAYYLGSSALGSCGGWFWRMGMSLPSAHLATPKKPLPTYAPISCPTAVHSSAHPHKISIVNIVNNNQKASGVHP